MLTRRRLFGFLGLSGAAAAAPAFAGGVALFDPGRRVTHLPGGGTLIEDETFATGIQINKANNLILSNNTFTMGAQKTFNERARPLLSVA